MSITPASTPIDVIGVERSATSITRKLEVASLERGLSDASQIASTGIPLAAAAFATPTGSTLSPDFETTTNKSLFGSSVRRRRLTWIISASQ